MRAEVIAIGDELTTGQRLDTNSQWLAEQLTECGIEVAFHTTIGDRLPDNIAAFRSAIERVEAVVVTGGLGPTADDLTREALAAAVGVGLVRDEASLAHIRRLFAERGREMPERNAVQADFPAGASAIPNEHGTAPGIAVTVERAGRPPCLVFALPGVPAEMKPMWAESVRPALVTALGTPHVTRHRRIKCFGVGESALEAMLPDLIRRGRDPTVGITVSDATITLRITASGAEDAVCREAMEPTIAIIRESLGAIVFGEEEDELEHAVARLLAEQGRTLAVAERATDGLVAQWLVGAGRSLGVEVFAGGVTIASQSQAEALAGAELPAAAADDSPAVAAALAEGIRARTGADFGLGIAAFPAVMNSPDARLHVAIATVDGTRRLRFGCASHPAILRPRAGKQALNAVRLALLKQDPEQAWK
ncbi:MAG: CinA family nicotinamide mononucleotide deamidase-related protein [Pirellulales bacterium]|nr:CinA family nicotinamide mononucleotide deamidase-related protein [Pirellulales bacterium]